MIMITETGIENDFLPASAFAAHRSELRGSRDRMRRQRAKVRRNPAAALAEISPYHPATNTMADAAEAARQATTGLIELAQADQAAAARYASVMLNDIMLAASTLIPLAHAEIRETDDAAEMRRLQLQVLRVAVEDWRSSRIPGVYLRRIASAAA